MTSNKLLCFTVCTLLWTAVSGCTPAALQPDTTPIGAPQVPAQPSIKSTSIPSLTPVMTPLSPVENSPIHLTPSPELTQPGSNNLPAQPQKETLQSARKDLAQRLGLSLENVTVLSVIGQEYSPDAFYCRTAKGRIAKEAPTQVISGETILLAAQGNRYEYHASDPLVIFCRLLP